MSFGECSVLDGKKVDEKAFNRLWELNVRELFESIFRVIMIFFLSVVDSNTCDKTRTVRPRTTCNNARNIDLRYLKGY